MLVVLQIIVFILGLLALFQAIGHAVFFSKGTTSLSWTMVAFLVEQMVSSLGTLVFATNSLLGTISGEDNAVWNNIDPSLAILLRSLMFLAMIHSTRAMAREIKRITEENENVRSK